jgi:hypothetical protein
MGIQIQKPCTLCDHTSVIYFTDEIKKIYFCKKCCAFLDKAKKLHFKT